MSAFSSSRKFVCSCVIASLFKEMSHHLLCTEKIHTSRSVRFAASLPTLLPSRQMNKLGRKSIRSITASKMMIYSAAKSSVLSTHLYVFAVVWCSAGRPWSDLLTAAANATAMTRRMTWCWECASMLSDFLSHTVHSSIRLLSHSCTTILCVSLCLYVTQTI